MMARIPGGPAIVEKDPEFVGVGVAIAALDFVILVALEIIAPIFALWFYVPCIGATLISCYAALWIMAAHCQAEEDEEEIPAILMPTNAGSVRRSCAPTPWRRCLQVILEDTGLRSIGEFFVCASNPARLLGAGLSAMALALLVFEVLLAVKSRS
jgi:hypothetical protein